jgi:hypothetical protein
VRKENIYPWTHQFEIHLEGRLFGITMSENIKKKHTWDCVQWVVLPFGKRKERTLKKVLEL